MSFALHDQLAPHNQHYKQCYQQNNKSIKMKFLNNQKKFLDLVIARASASYCRCSCRYRVSVAATLIGSLALSDS